MQIDSPLSAHVWCVMGFHYIAYTCELWKPNLFCSYLLMHSIRCKHVGRKWNEVNTSAPMLKYVVDVPFLYSLSLSLSFSRGACFFFVLFVLSSRFACINNSANNVDRINTIARMTIRLISFLFLFAAAVVCLFVVAPVGVTVVFFVPK